MLIASFGWKTAASTNVTRRIASISRRSRGIPIRTGRRDWLWVVALIVIAGIFVMLGVMFVIAASQTKADEPPIAGIECNRSEQTDYHVHPQLIIYIEGQLVSIPNNLGIVEGECVYWLHTHDASTGTIHVEAPREDNYTLGQFFAIWAQPLSATQLLDSTTDAEHSIRATVNGEEYTGDPADIPLTDHAVIILEYGPPFREG